MATIHRYGDMIGQSRPLQDVFDRIDRSAKIDVPVLIEGETGTGKDMIAREVHRRSRRASKPFVAVNMGAISREIIASDLFGHVRGAFTGATENKEGRFSEAHGGTLFLDEISTMEERMQVSLLRVLESHSFRPLGAKRDVTVDVRLIAATNGDLDEEVARGEFREDLVHRLRVFRITAPPLRKIRDDIPALSYFFLDQVRREFELDVNAIEPEAMDLLRAYDWPGNIRELKNVIAQSAVMAESGIIEARLLPERFNQSFGGEEREAPRPSYSSTASRNNNNQRNEVSETSTNTQEGMFVPFGCTLDEIEEQYVRKTLASVGGNKTKAAKVLGISRKTLYDRLKRWEPVG